MSLREWLWAACLGWLVVPGWVAAQSPQLVAETEPLTAAEQLGKFHLPPGFRIELIAAEPACQKPMNLKFDASGRLWFTQSIEYPWSVEDGKPARDTIRVMSDSNADGVPDSMSVFAEGLNIPIGITPVYGGVLAHSIPSLNWFPDADGNRVADGKQEYYRQFGFRDTHGMCSSLNWWVDGWVYGCHGFANDSEVAGADGRPIKLQSGNTYRLRPEGTHIEYMTHGQVNPFGMCFDPLGNQFTSDCHTKPAYVMLRGAYYPSFGKPHDGLGFGPELMQHLHGSTGIAGVVYYAARQFPPEYRENIFLGNPVTGRINRDTLSVHGSTYKAVEQPDFLTCDDPWFRPVDLQLAPDGSLYIADFYNRIIGHYEVPLTHPGRDRERGRIWRVSYVGTEGQPQSAPKIPDLTQATAAELVDLLGHAHLPVRVQATHQLVHRIGDAGVPAVASAFEQGTPEQRAHALWVLERLRQLNDARIQTAAGSDRLVRVHLTKALAERPEWSPSVRQLVEDKLLHDSDHFVRRAAIDAAGRHPRAGLERRLIEAWQDAPIEDELQIHTARMAVRDCLAALPELGQLPIETWTAGERAKLLESLLGLPTAGSAAVALRCVELDGWPDHLAEALAQHVQRHAADEQQAAVDRLPTRYQSAGMGLQIAILRAGQRGAQERGRGLSPAWTGWAQQVGSQLLSQTDEGTVRAGLELVRDLRLAELASQLPTRLQPEAGLPGLRMLVLDTLATVNHPELVVVLTDVLRRDDVAGDVRQHAANLLGSLNRDEARAVLTAQVQTAPYQMALAIARGLTQTGVGAQEFLALVEAGKAAPRLLQDATIDQRLRSARLENFDARRERLLEGLPPENTELLQLLTQRKAAFTQGMADVANGRKVFEKTCAACHRLANQGGKVGPELDGVGLRGLDRLLEDTLDPNRNVDAAFLATTLVLNDGRVRNGLIAREEGAVLVLIDEQGKELLVPLNEIEERQKTRLSPMPANISEKLTPQEYSDLLGFLLQQRIAPTKPVSSAP